MRMLYIFNGGGTRHTSVQAKIEAKIDCFNSEGVETHGVFLSQEVQEPVKINDNIRLHPVGRVPNKYFTAIFQKKRYAEVVSELIEKEQANYEVIYFRYPGASKHLVPMLKKYGHKILFEHNTKELEEWKLLGEEISFGLRPSDLFRWLQDKKWKIAHEARYARPMLQAVRMGLAVTNDMADYEVERAGGKYNCIGNSNGADVSKIKVRNPPTYDGSELVMMFMRGANTNAPYHGVDRLLSGLKAYTGPVKMKLLLVGAYFANEVDWVEKNGVSHLVEFTGKLLGDELDALFDRCHLSFGSLGLHRIKMWEGSVLKVNESLARGIPVAVSYKDMELHYNEEFNPYYVQFPADDTDIDLNAVVGLVEKVYQDKLHPQKMRLLAERIVDYKVKTKRAVELIRKEFNL